MKVSKEGETVPSVVPLLLTPIVTLAVGWLLSLTVNVAVPPASVVLPLMLLTVNGSIVKGVIVRILLAFPAESVTVIVQSEYVPSFKESKVMILFPEVADVVLEVQDPPYVMVPA